MFNIGPMELGVLVLVGLIVLGPDRVPGLARDAAKMLKTLRDLATGARTQLRDELGPEFADVKLDALNDLRELRALNPRTAIRRALIADDDTGGVDVAAVEAPVDLSKPATPPPLGRGEKAPFDADAT